MTNQIALSVVTLFLCLWTVLLARFKGYSALCWFFAGGIVGVLILWRLPAFPEPQFRVRANALGTALSALSLLAAMLLKSFL